MPIGACNTEAMFQMVTNQISHDCMLELVMVYIADFMIFNKDLESHYDRLETVLQRFHDNELYASPRKWEIF